MIEIKSPLTKQIITSLHPGDEVSLSGTIYTARDQAHKRLIEAIRRRRKLPLDLKDQIVYYCGPTNTPKGKIIGSCGPTTSSRMDRFTPQLLKVGLKGMIGKGICSPEVIKAIRKYKAIYFLAPAGCGALLAKKVNSAKIVTYKDLGPEAIRRLEIKNFPLIVGIDSKGRSIYQMKP
ncbi:MAG: fumarate hydratase C-terminal domain-containing protein [Candidatus Omnitrophica bacterium]|nr:fumarate hydratase C-terminal domain-containing protein [Candidatus Omnitrophota bacterium]